LVVVSARNELTDDRPGWGSGAINQVCVRLEPLEETDAAELVRQAGGSRLGEEQRAAIVGRAGGNPFFIVESTGMLLREGAGHDDEALIPPTVQAMIAARLDSLPPELRDLARRLSVFRYDFDPDEVALVSDAAEAELEQLIEVPDPDLYAALIGNAECGLESAGALFDRIKSFRAVDHDS